MTLLRHVAAPTGQRRLARERNQKNPLAERRPKTAGLVRDAFYKRGEVRVKVRLIALASALMALFHVAGANFKG
jgi:hypothetical protein